MLTKLYFFLSQKDGLVLFLTLSFTFSHPLFIQGVALRVGRVSQSVNEAWEKEINSVALGQFWSCYHLFAGLSLAAGLPPRALPCLRPMQTAVDEGPCEGRVQGFIRHPQRWDQKQMTGIGLLTAPHFYSYLFVFKIWFYTEISSTMMSSRRISVNISCYPR